MPVRRILLHATVASLCFTSAEAQTRPPTGCTATPKSARVVSVKAHGAKGDGRTDDTAAIQAALDQIEGTGGTVVVPDGQYLINTGGAKRLTLGSDTTLRLSEGATLKAMPTAAKHFSILTIADASNVTVTGGGTLHGERREHLVKTGEYGMGIWIGPGAAHITISGITSREMWGDGFIVADATDVRLCSVVADRNRRQGLSVIEVDGLLVTDSVFSNTSGTRPSSGIDLEPNKASEQIKNVRIQDSKFVDNDGAGILISGKKNAKNIFDVEITHNVFTGILPIKIEHAPAVLDSAICRNRLIGTPSEPSDNLSRFSSATQVIVPQSECGDRRLEIRR